MSYENPRIALNDSVLDCVVKLSEGNPGAMRVLMEICENAPSIDPDDAFGSLGAMINFDNCDIYGSRIWMLYKDVCGQDLTKTLALGRAVQLGYLPLQDLDKWIDEGKQDGVDGMLAKVKEFLPDFGKEQAR